MAQKQGCSRGTLFRCTESGRNCIRSSRQCRWSGQVIGIERSGCCSAVDVADEIYDIKVRLELLPPDEID